MNLTKSDRLFNIYLMNQHKKTVLLDIMLLAKCFWLVLFGFLPLNSTFCKSNIFNISDIKIEGLTRGSKTKICNHLGIGIDRIFNQTISNQAIKKLYQTGFFNNIQMYQSKNVLTVKVVERPAISQVNFKGNNKIKTEVLSKALKEAGLDIGNIFKPEILFNIKHSLLIQYSLMGYYSTHISVIEEFKTSNRVAIKIIISEGKTARARRINILGNNQYLEKNLLVKFNFMPPSILNAWGLFGSKNEYSAIKINSSIENLNSVYMDNGYLEFHVLSHQASITPDKENIYISFDISEGKVYKVSKIKLDGKLILPKAKIEKLITLHRGSVFSRKKILNTTNAITSALSEIGYAFAKVHSSPEINKEKNIVMLTFYIDPGKKVYINQINFFGNNVTRDHVYRRQIQYYEFGLYNQKMIDQSTVKLHKMPFIEGVELKKESVTGVNDLIDMSYYIKECNANMINASIGYSELHKFMLDGNVSLPNLLGTGNQFSIGANVSSINQNLNLSYTYPFFTISGISQTIKAYISKTNYDNKLISSYQLNQYGIILNYSIPTFAFNYVNIGGSIDHTQLLEPSSGTSSIVKWFIDKNNYQIFFNTLTINFGWNHDSTNKALFPTSGKNLSIDITASIPGSDLEWYKAKTSARLFQSFLNHLTLSVTGGIDYGDGYRKTKHLPIFQNFYGGGWHSVRGFDQGSMGPIDTYKKNGSDTIEKGNAIGGNLNIYSNIDILFPIPGSKSLPNMRLGIFYDMGNIYNTHSFSEDTLWSTLNSYKKPHLSNLRYSVGIQFQWLSPVGPMAFSLAKPLNVKDSDSTQNFQFTLGQIF